MNAPPAGRSGGLFITGVGSLVLLAAVLATADAAEQTDRWPQFRGPHGNGHAEATGLPTKWSEKENITWKIAVPGKGFSSPVVGKKSIWMTTGTKGGRSLRAVCVDRRTGKLLQNVEVFGLAKPMVIGPTNSHASPTPVLDEGRLYVHFGTSGNACLDAETGKILWKNNELKIDHEVGPGSSPIVWKNLLIVNYDGQFRQFVAAFDKKDGRVVWTTKRSGKMHPNGPMRKAFTTPTIIQESHRTQLVSPSSDWTYSYDPATGKELWRVGYGRLGFSVVSRPVVGHGMVFVSTGFGGPPSELLAIRYDGTGDVTGSHVVWRFNKRVPLKGSILLAGDLIYMSQDKGIGTCLDAVSGKVQWIKRLSGSYAASPLFADGRIYFFSEQGTTTVIKPGRKFEVLAVNKLKGRFKSSAAVAGKALFLRTVKHLYRVERPRK